MTREQLLDKYEALAFALHYEAAKPTTAVAEQHRFRELRRRWWNGGYGRRSTAPAKRGGSKRRRTATASC